MATVLFSKVSMRVIWNDGNFTYTSKLNPDFTYDSEIHAAPIGLWDMAQAFSNKPINDWQKASITKWDELKEVNK